MIDEITNKSKSIITIYQYEYGLYTVLSCVGRRANSCANDLNIISYLMKLNLVYLDLNLKSFGGIAFFFRPDTILIKVHYMKNSDSIEIKMTILN